VGTSQYGAFGRFGEELCFEFGERVEVHCVSSKEEEEEGDDGWVGRG